MAECKLEGFDAAEAGDLERREEALTTWQCRRRHQLIPVCQEFRVWGLFH